MRGIYALFLFQAMCHRYWPDETTGSEMHGPFEISLHSVREYPDYILRELKIVDTRVSLQHVLLFFLVGIINFVVPVLSWRKHMFIIK